MEDDMVWDMYLRSICAVVLGVRYILSKPHRSHSPCGYARDVMRLGHCGEPLPQTLKQTKA